MLEILAYVFVSLSLLHQQSTFLKLTMSTDSKWLPEPLRRRQGPRSPRTEALECPVGVDAVCMQLWKRGVRREKLQMKVCNVSMSVCCLPFATFYQEMKTSETYEF